MENKFNDLRYADLIWKKIKNEISNEEQAELTAWLQADVQHQEAFEQLMARKNVRAAMEFQESIDTQADWESVLARADTGRAMRPYRKVLLAGLAAAVLGGVVLVGYNWNRITEEKKITAEVKKLPVIRPASNTATLTLGNGKEVKLGSQPGVIQETDGTDINQQNGALQYHKGATNSEELIYNLLTTPKAGQYQLTLEDGTRVWLNAASSLRFPVHFGKGEREVELTGEGYFDVAQDPSKPFKVKVREVEVQVLGTGFNIGAYENEVKTTLVSGAVKVALNGNHSWRLKPGQEARVSNTGVNIGKADIEKITAWKDGVFFFRDDDFRDIMNEVARWYDVSIRYEGNVPVKRITGNISRQAGLPQVLEMLSFVSGARFKINGRVIDVM